VRRRVACNALLIIFIALFGGTLLVSAAPVPSPRIVLISGEPEYYSSNTLPVFAKYLETNFQFRCTFLQRTDSNNIPGLNTLEEADLAIIFLRRLTLPEEQLNRFKTYIRSGKPLIGLRTASHAFENWKEWDHEVLGGNYHMHHGNQFRATAHVVPEARSHPILRNVASEFETAGSLYKTSPLGDGTTLLLTGTVEGQPAEPTAWTHTYINARIFYTSLGHPQDFENPSFHKLLVNAVFWCLRKAPFVGTAELEQLIRDQGAVILDVRRPEEFAAGHLPGALNLNVEDNSFEQRAKSLATNRTYVVHCVHGIRSAQAVDKLNALHFPSVLDYSEGFAAWQRAGKPVEK